MIQTRRAFTLVELAVAVLTVGILVGVLAAAGTRQRKSGQLAVSLQNVATQLVAAHMYHADNAGRAPMRGCGYSNGQVQGGWDGWNYGGKNCSTFWAGGAFDEPAYARPLNAYMRGSRHRVPTGYINTGSGATWNLVHGTPTAADRIVVQNEQFHSPGDTRSYERTWPNPTTTVSGYDDFGTSYVVNMKWWDDPSMAGLGFSARYIEGCRRINLAFGGANPSYVWVCDQVGDVVPYYPATTQLPGEFGKINYSVFGWVDGRVGYMPVVSNASSGPGYTFLP